MDYPSLSLYVSPYESSGYPIFVKTVNFFCRHPFQFFKLFIWSAKGLANFKLRSAEFDNLDISVLPYNQ